MSQANKLHLVSRTEGQWINDLPGIPSPTKEFTPGTRASPPTPTPLIRARASSTPMEVSLGSGSTQARELEAGSTNSTKGLDLSGHRLLASLSSKGLSPNTRSSGYDPRFSFGSSYIPTVESPLPLEDGRPVIVVLGSGDFAQALTIRLVQANYKVVVASRNPDKSRVRVEAAGGVVMKHAEALTQSLLVVVAVPFQHYASLPFTELRHKVLVDVSNKNPGDEHRGRSNAEHLQDYVETASVVKALNTLSAYTLLSGSRGSKEVPVCGDSDTAKDLVRILVRDLGYVPSDHGSLRQARLVEAIPLQFFPEWRLSFILATILFFILWIFFLFRYDLCKNLQLPANSTWNLDVFNDAGLENTHAACAVSCIILLSATYLPGVLAAYLQLIRGTKYSVFPGWLDAWLRTRKQLGLYALLFALLHGMMVVTLWTMAGSSFRMAKAVDDAWRTPTFLALGITTLVTLGLLGVASLPSVSEAMTWREFSFVQSKLGWFALVLATGHIVIIGWNNLISPFKCYVLPSGAQLGLVLPAITIVMKLPLLMPCVNSRLTKIRGGWERRQKPSERTV